MTRILDTFATQARKKGKRDESLKKKSPRAKAGQETYQAREGIRASYIYIYIYILISRRSPLIPTLPHVVGGVFVDPVFGPCRIIVLAMSELFISKWFVFGRVGTVRTRRVVGLTD